MLPFIPLLIAVSAALVALVSAQCVLAERRPKVVPVRAQSAKRRGR